MSALRIRWFPASWIQLKAAGKVVYFDPAFLLSYFKDYEDKTVFTRWPNPIDGLPAGLEPADLILITHHHKDHCKRVTVDRLSTPATVIVAPASCRKELGEGFLEIAPGQTLRAAGLNITALHAYNTPEGSSTQKQHKPGKGVGYVLTIAGKRIYHAGDTDLIEDMKSLRDIDVAFIPVGGKFTMDASEAAEAARIIAPKVVIPIHHLASDPTDFEKKLRAHPHIRCIVPEIGREILIH